MGIRCLHFDPFSGISGDMTLGALLDLGVPIDFLRSELAKLGVSGYELEVEQVHCSGIRAARCLVRTEKAHSHRHLGQIERIIQSSGLDDWVQERSLAAFRRLADAEARVHGQPVEKVHFHEVGALDAIVDVVGAMIGFRRLGVQQFSCGTVQVGGGEVICDHGRLPVPAPATAELLQGVTVRGDDSAGELTTPTGAAILRAVCDDFRGLPPFRIQALGHGAGSRPSLGRPNVLRLILGERDDPVGETPGWRMEEPVTLLECNLDDASPQLIGHFLERAFLLGALDVYSTPVHMKKNRPGFLLSVLSREENVAALLELIFRETTTLGIRIRRETRVVLQRDEVAVNILNQTVRLKIGRLGTGIVSLTAEYEDCRRVAESSGRPLKVIQALAVNEYLKTTGEIYGGS